MRRKKLKRRKVRYRGSLKRAEHVFLKPPRLGLRTSGRLKRDICDRDTFRATSLLIRVIAEAGWLQELGSENECKMQEFEESELDLSSPQKLLRALLASNENIDIEYRGCEPPHIETFTTMLEALVEKRSIRCTFIRPTANAKAESLLFQPFGICSSGNHLYVCGRNPVQEPFFAAKFINFTYPKKSNLKFSIPNSFSWLVAKRSIRDFCRHSDVEEVGLDRFGRILRDERLNRQ